jgi:hypothetical protein
MRLVIRRVWTAILLAVLIVLSVGWARSFAHPDVLAVFGPSGRPLIVTFGHGAVYCCVSNLQLGEQWAYRFAWSREPIAAFDQTLSNVLAATINHAGRFKFLAGEGHPVFDRPRTWFVVAGMPLWLAWPVVAWLTYRRFVVLIRRRRRKTKGLCAVCGYDLRESPRRCPECGTAGVAAMPTQSET